MQQIRDGWAKRWSFYPLNIWKGHNNFVPLPQEHKEYEHTQHNNDDASSCKDIDQEKQPTFYERFLKFKRDSLPKQILRHCSTYPTDIHHSKAHLLTTSQLVGLMYFALTGGNFGLQACIGIGGPTLMLLAFCFLPFIWGMPLTLMAQEMTCMIPESGGHVLWVYRAFGPFWSYINGAFSFATSALDNAMYLALFMEYLSRLLPTTSEFFAVHYQWSFLFKVFILLIPTTINIYGIHHVGNVSLIFTILGVITFVLMFFMGIKYTNFSWLGSPLAKNVDRGKFMALVLWNTAGYDIVATVASEVMTPSVSYPKAWDQCFLLQFTSNIMPVVIASGIYQNQEDWNLGTYFRLAGYVGGNSFKVWMGIVGLISAMGLLLVHICTNARILYGMAQVDQMPAALTMLCPKNHTPVNAILLTTICTIIIDLFDVYQFVEASMLFYALSTLLKFGSLIQLRYSEPDVLRPFQIPLDNKLLILYMLIPMSMCIIMVVNASQYSQGIALIGTSVATFCYIGKEYFAQYGLKEVAEARLVRVNENLQRMQRRIDNIIESELRLKESKTVNVALKNWIHRAKSRQATQTKT